MFLIDKEKNEAISLSKKTFQELEFKERKHLQEWISKNTDILGERDVYKRQDEEGNLVIIPEEAELVKRIFREYLEGSSMDRIKKGLEADGILTVTGKKKWYTSTIRGMLSNEKYMGDALLQKTYTCLLYTSRCV